MNNQGANLFGHRRDELIGLSVEMLVPDRFRCNHALLRVGFTAHPSNRPMGAGRDLYGLRKDGSEFPVEIGLGSFTVDDNDLSLAIVTNITERKRVEQALVESAARQATLYEFADRLHRAAFLVAIYNAALDAMLMALHCDRASILLRDAKGVMRFVGWRGLSDGYRRAVDGHSPWAGSEPDPQPVYVADIAKPTCTNRLRPS
jgi:PAS domain S-box-containing protein